MEKHQKRQKYKTTVPTILLSIIATVIALAILFQVGFVANTFALTRYFNCTTRIANNNNTISLANIEACYDKVFQGAK
jgi:accessory gene regulator protein AgrB